jgi:hypothetical protein
MALIIEQVEVSKEARELSKELGILVKKILAAKASGLGSSAMIAAIASELSGIVSAVDGYDQLPVEMKSNPEAFLKAWGLGGAEIAGAFLPSAPVTA